MLNEQKVMGYLGHDPEVVFQRKNGEPMLSLRIATTDTWTEEVDGETVEKSHTEWHTVLCFGDYAKKKAESYKKGDLLFASGKTRTRKSAAKDGTVYENRVILPDSLRLISRKPQTDGPDGGQTKQVTDAGVDNTIDHDEIQDSSTDLASEAIAEIG